jgi:hypothetical protein
MSPVSIQRSCKSGRALALDHPGRARQHQRADQRQAQPGGIGPPQDAAQPEHRREQQSGRYQQRDRHQVQALEGLAALAGRKRHQGHGAQQHQGDAQFGQQQPLPLRPGEEIQRHQARQRRPELRQAHADHQGQRPGLERENLQQVVDGGGGQGGRGQAAGGAHYDGRRQTWYAEVQQGGQRVGGQQGEGDLGDAELRARLDEDQVGAGVEADIDRWQQAGFGGVETLCAGQAGDVDIDHAIAEGGADAGQYRDGGIGRAAPGGMRGDVGRAREGWRFRGSGRGAVWYSVNHGRAARQRGANGNDLLPRLRERLSAWACGRGFLWLPWY